jgi:hypothetical protein
VIHRSELLVSCGRRRAERPCFNGFLTVVGKGTWCSTGRSCRAACACLFGWFLRPDTWTDSASPSPTRLFEPCAGGRVSSESRGRLKPENVSYSPCCSPALPPDSASEARPASGGQVPTSKVCMNIALPCFSPGAAKGDHLASRVSPRTESRALGYQTPAIPPPVSKRLAGLVQCLGCTCHD